MPPRCSVQHLWLNRCRRLCSCHCLSGVENPLYLLKALTRNDDGSLIVEPPAMISVHAIGYESVSDIAILKNAEVANSWIPLCPLAEFPTTDNEDRVKSYHYPISMFTDNQVDTISVMSTDYSKIPMTSRHHMFITGEHMKGSSGSVVVETRGRAVSLICSGYAPGLRLSCSEPFETNWEMMTVLSDRSGLFTKTVKFSAVPNLYSFLANN
jgi:hypothetical protein